jgi:hypothetical protein
LMTCQSLGPAFAHQISARNLDGDGGLDAVN